MGIGSRTCTKMKFPHLQLAKVPSALKWAGPSNCPVAGLEVGTKEFLCAEAKVGKYLAVYWGEAAFCADGTHKIAHGALLCHSFLILYSSSPMMMFYIQVTIWCSVSFCVIWRSSWVGMQCAAATAVLLCCSGHTSSYGQGFCTN